MKAVVKVPSLKVVADNIAADKLRELLKDADDGLRRVVRCGLYIEWINANLQHGQFRAWLAANAPDVSEPTTRRWRSLARNICEWAGLKSVNLTHLPAGSALLLDCPAETLPAEVREAREKMDTLLDSARTPKQLFLDMGFKQGELDAAGYPRSKPGRRKGSNGNPKAVRQAAQERDDHAALVDILGKMEEFTEILNDNRNLVFASRVDELPGGALALSKFQEAVSGAHFYFLNLMKGRGQHD
jgi:hypothetical protein